MLDVKTTHSRPQSIKRRNWFSTWAAVPTIKPQIFGGLDWSHKHFLVCIGHLIPLHLGRDTNISHPSW